MNWYVHYVSYAAECSPFLGAHLFRVWLKGKADRLVRKYDRRKTYEGTMRCR